MRPLVLLLLVACASDPPAKGDTATAPTPVTTPAGTSPGTGGPCVLEEAEAVDWMAPGPHGVGRLLYAGVSDLDGVVRDHDVQLTYPAVTDGTDVPAAAGPFPVILFEHAGGSDYLNNDWLIDRLASRGFVVLSAGHNGAWDGSPFWDNHADLFRETHALAATWNDDPTSPVAGALDLGTLVLMGHSHGGGASLHVMGDLAPEAVVLITPRPSRDGDFESYHTYYDGMPPLLNVAAGRDEDSTTAFGQAVGVYEADTRPRFMVTVDGASHYTFTDDRSIGPSTIEREAGWASGGSAVVAFLEHRIHDDVRGLQALRGDAPLFTDGAPVRTQSHPDDVIVVDDFEGEALAESAAIVGIAGQTFVNGFLGDTFVDLDAGVDLLVAQIEALSGSGDTVLFYQDASRDTDAYAIALGRVDREVTTVTTPEALRAALDEPWPLVVATQQDGGIADTHPFDEPLAAWICAGGHAILADFRHASLSAATTFACAGAAFDGTLNATRVVSTGDLFDGELAVQNTAWGVFSYGLSTDHTVYAVNGETVEAPGRAEDGPRGPVVRSGLDTFAEVSALDPVRALYMPTGALEVAWTAPASVRWELDPPLDATDRDVLALRLLQVHDDPLNAGDVTVAVEVTDAAGGSATATLTVGPTMDWLESTVPKSVFETFRVPLAAHPVDVTQLAAVTLRFGDSPSGRLLVDDLELTPGLRCLPE